jgi:hypothetical protein
MKIAWDVDRLTVHGVRKRLVNRKDYKLSSVQGTKSHKHELLYPDAADTDVWLRESRIPRKGVYVTRGHPHLFSTDKCLVSTDRQARRHCASALRVGASAASEVRTHSTPRARGCQDDSAAKYGTERAGDSDVVSTHHSPYLTEILSPVETVSR